MGGSDEEGSLKKEKKEKKDKDKDKDKDKGHKDEKKDKGKEKEKDKDEKKDKKDKDGGEKKDKDKKDKDKKDKDKDKKDKGKDEKGKDEKGKDKEKDKDKKEKKDKKDKKDEDEDEDGEDGKKKKKKKDKDKDKAKDKDKKDKPSHPPGVNVSSGPVLGGEASSYYDPSGAPPKPPSQPGHPPQSGEVPWFLREPGAEVHGQPPRADPPFPNPNPHYTTFQQPLPQQPSRAVGDTGGVQPPQTVPPSGYRIPLDPNAQFPTPDQLGRPPATDFNSSTGPIFIGSAIFPDSVHPCKITPSLNPPCRVSYNGTEFEHHGRYDLLPITLDMEWVPTANGQIPPGRRPVEGGYESNGEKLYHALGTIQGVQVPGKAGDRIRGASIPFGGSEHILQESYSVLCWK